MLATVLAFVIGVLGTSALAAAAIVSFAAGRVGTALLCLLCFLSPGPAIQKRGVPAFGADPSIGDGALMDFLEAMSAGVPRR